LQGYSFGPALKFAAKVLKKRLKMGLKGLMVMVKKFTLVL
jgi:hypothetical protein